MADSRNGMRPILSENDEMVFTVIRSAKGPLSAYDIRERLRPDRLRIAQPTVDRALKHLMADGRVWRIETANACLRADDRAPGTVVLSIRGDCGRVQQRDAAAEVERITRALAKDGVHPTHPMVEVRGRCGDGDVRAKTMAGVQP